MNYTSRLRTYTILVVKMRENRARHDAFVRLPTNRAYASLQTNAVCMGASNQHNSWQRPIFVTELLHVPAADHHNTKDAVIMILL